MTKVQVFSWPKFKSIFNNIGLIKKLSPVTSVVTPGLTPLRSDCADLWFAGKLLLAHMGLLGPALAVV